MGKAIAGCLGVLASIAGILTLLITLNILHPFGSDSTPTHPPSGFGKGCYKIQSRSSGKVLEVSNFSTSDGGTVDQWTWVNQTNEEWTITLVG